MTTQVTTDKPTLTFTPIFSDPKIKPFDQIEWENRTAEITDDSGKTVFKQEEASVPKSWSMLATKIVVSKYFYGEQNTTERESSVKQLIHRVCRTIANWGIKDGYFDAEDGEVFYNELVWLCVNQYGAFNSPVWFNVGLYHQYMVGKTSGEGNWFYDRKLNQATRASTQYEYPQAAACFIQSVDDNMEAIMRLAYSEAMLFKFGSGTGTDLSTIRSSKEKLSGGGKPSGPMSFLRIYDQVANVVKSGGKTRRAAKMNTLRDWHGDIEEFINAKKKEEKKAWALIEQGYNGSYNGDAYGSVVYQNENLSVRASDEFMQAAIDNKDWWTKAVTSGKPLEKKSAAKLLDDIAEGTWICGDPGLQYDGAIQKWHTCKGTEPIHSTNPCCFTGDTLVDTSEGMIPFAELIKFKEISYAFSFDLKTGKPVLRKINKVWISGKTDKLVEVVTEKGIKVKCTPEHVFILRNGKECQAKNLAPGDRLRKIYRDVNKRRAYRRCIGHKDGTEWQNRFIWEQINGPIPNGFEVHHLNEDATDDRYSNFELRQAFDHKSGHSSGPNNSRFIEADVQLFIETWEAVETSRDGWDVTPSRWNAYVKNNGIPLPQAQSPTLGGNIHGMSWTEFKDWINNNRAIVNDKVVSVSPVVLENGVEVFDLEVEDTHNFGVSSPGIIHSVVVHNSEYVFLNNTACNLASLNLMKFKKDDATFDIERFKAAVRIFITAQEILVDNASYPTKEIAENSHIFRTLGLGYANLGSLIMSYGLAYDSDEGRALAGAISAIMTGESYCQSSRLAEVVGTFPGYHDARCAHVKNPVAANNVDSMMQVIRMHKGAVEDIQTSNSFAYLKDEARSIWGQALELGHKFGYRNAQVTVLAPTGTIGFLMDCDTTGVEPDIALVKYKLLAGGGMLKIVNKTVPEALYHLGYSNTEIHNITKHVESFDTIEDCGTTKSGLSEKHLPVFDCAFKAQNGKRSIHYMGHLKMMAAVQPFISGAISKTVNLPHEATVNDIKQAYVEAWKMGLKCVAIYRDGSKRSQPLNTSKDKATDNAVERELMTKQLSTLEAALLEARSASGRPVRRRLPDTRKSLTHKFDIAGHEGYLTVGLFEDGQPGELFITMAKEGSTVAGLVDTVGTLTSMALQYGVPLEALVRKFQYQRFEPAGYTKNPEIRNASSIIDYVFRWLEVTFREFKPEVELKPAKKPLTLSETVAHFQMDAPSCLNCGNVTVRNGACYRCVNCGESAGCS